MDEKMKELLSKMRELGISEEDFRKTLNTAAVEEAERPGDKVAFAKTYKEVRIVFKNIVKEIYQNNGEVDKSVYKAVMGPLEFKAEFRELAISEVTRVVRMLDEMVIKLAEIDGREETRKIFLDMMISYEDVVYGNMSLFRFVPLEVFYAFVTRVGADKPAAYEPVTEQKEKGLAILSTQKEIEKAKEDMLNLMASVFRTPLDRILPEIYIKEFVRLVNLKDYAFDNLVEQNDIFIMYGSIISLLLLVGLLKTGTITKIGLSELKFEVMERTNAEEILKLIGNVE